ELPELLVGPVEPIRAPDPMDPPAAIPQDALTQAIAVPGRARGMIRRAVALDPEQVATRARGIDYRQVDDEAGRTDLGMDLVAEVFQGPGHLPLEVRVVISPRGLPVVQDAGRRVAEEGLEDRSPARPGALEVDVVGRDRAEDVAALAGA